MSNVTLVSALVVFCITCLMLIDRGVPTNIICSHVKVDSACGGVSPLVVSSARHSNRFNNVLHVSLPLTGRGVPTDLVVG